MISGTELLSGPQWKRPVTLDCTAMSTAALYAALGLEPTASIEVVKATYKSLARQHHPDKSAQDPRSEVFKQINFAYHTIIAIASSRDHSFHESTSSDHSFNESTSPEEDQSHQWEEPIQIQQNKYSTTVNISKNIFLIMFDICKEKYQNANISERGQNGIQMTFSLSSASDVGETCGRVSLTFYLSTSVLHVQGSSHLLWVEEHLPWICAEAECLHAQDTEKWEELAKQLGVGNKFPPHPSPSSPDRSTATFNIHHCPSYDQIHRHASVEKPTSPTYDTNTCGTHTHTSELPMDEKPPQHNTCDTHAVEEPIITCESPMAEKPPHTCESHTVEKPNHPCEHPVNATSTATKSNKTSSKRSKVGKKGRNIVFPCPIDGCSINSRQTVPMTRCMLCMGWFHNVCIGEECDYAGVWTCSTCRNIPTQLSNLEAHILNLNTTIENLQKRAPKNDDDRLMSENNSLKQKVSHLEDRNRDLSKLVESMFHTSHSSSNVTQGHPQSYVPPRESNVPLSDTNTEPHIHYAVPTSNMFNVFENASYSTCGPSVSSSPAPHANTERNLNHPKARRSKSGPTGLLASRINSPNSHANTERNQTSHASTEKSQSGHPVSHDVTNMVINQHSHANTNSHATTERNLSSNHSPLPSKLPYGINIIGDSMVRGVAELLDSSDDHDADGYVNPGRTAKQINGKIRNIPTSEVTVIQAGTNNTPRQSANECFEEIRQVLDNVARKRKDRTVIFCQLPRRYDEPHLNNKIKKVNQMILLEVKKYTNVHLLCHDVVRGDFDKGGLHFNDRGVAKFALQIRHILRNVGNPQ